MNDKPGVWTAGVWTVVWLLVVAVLVVGGVIALGGCMVRVSDRGFEAGLTVPTDRQVSQTETVREIPASLEIHVHAEAEIDKHKRAETKVDILRQPKEKE